jgi:hypothetical protein
MLIRLVQQKIINDLSGKWVCECFLRALLAKNTHSSEFDRAWLLSVIYGLRPVNYR